MLNWTPYSIRCWVVFVRRLATNDSQWRSSQLSLPRTGDCIIRSLGTSLKSWRALWRLERCLSLDTRHVAVCFSKYFYRSWNICGLQNPRFMLVWAWYSSELNAHEYWRMSLPFHNTCRLFGAGKQSQKELPPPVTLIPFWSEFQVKLYRRVENRTTRLLLFGELMLGSQRLRVNVTLVSP